MVKSFFLAVAVVMSILGLSLLLPSCGLEHHSTGPGGDIQFQVVLPPPVTWTADGGSITTGGLWTAPACGAATFPATFHITATSPGGTQSFTVSIAEAVLSVSVICAQASGDTVCKPPPVTLRPGQTAQFYAKTSFSCHDEFTPSRPAGF